jgi:hypothetical protein
MVDVPVMANTVQRRAISPYHLGVQRGGISFGAIHRCKNDMEEPEDDDDSAAAPFLEVALIPSPPFGLEEDVVIFRQRVP